MIEKMKSKIAVMALKAVVKFDEKIVSKCEDELDIEWAETVLEAKDMLEVLEQQ